MLRFKIIREAYMQKKMFKLGAFELIWLNGGKFALDGGATFGVVPKALWTKKYPADEDNCIPLLASPILVKTPDALILIETGVGNKLDEKQRKIFRLQEEWQIPQDLASLSINREDIDFVILTHYDWDHAGGVVMKDTDGGFVLTFPKAKHIIQKTEWREVLNPNRRSVNSYWPVNYETLDKSNNLALMEGTQEIVRGVKVIHTGGHNKGHQIVRIESQGEVALHLADLLPTHAHFNPLWVMAYDQFPIDVIALKEKWEQAGLNENAWFTFYHDPFMRACKFDEKGNVMEKWE
jgi:glyoxylase-like metal-dependent hydrolase (beta-lactamase superfamily II)